MPDTSPISDGAPALTLARNIAIIADGNGRWASARGLHVNQGHQAGADTLKARLRDAVEFGIEQLTRVLVLNYLLWQAATQAAHAELLFRHEPWPDFTRQAFAEPLTDYSQRQRRHGTRAPTPTPQANQATSHPHQPVR